MAAKAVCVLKSEKVNGVIRFAQEVRNLLILVEFQTTWFPNRF